MGSDKLTVLVGSKNPTKINAVKNGLKRVFYDRAISVLGHNVESGVPDQPIGYEETKSGAENRIKNLKHRGADFYIGIEGGCVYVEKKLFAFAWVLTEDRFGCVGSGKTSMFQLPKKIQKLIDKGVELGEADDLVFKRSESKKKNGAVGILTNNLIDRTKYYEEAVILSLIPFINKKLLF